MTDKEKAKAYDEALDRCKEWASGTCEQSVNNSPKDVAEFIFPQLAKSEDEKIREFLIGILSQGTWRKEWPFSPNEVVAYLERQNHVQSDTEKEYVRTLKSLIFNFLRGKDEVDRDYYQRIEDWLDGRHVEQEEQIPTSFNEPYNPDNYEVVIEGNATSLKRKEQKSTNELEDAFKYYTDRGITISCGDFKAEPKKEQKSAEWSEEDKKMLWIIQLALTKHPITDKQEKDAFDWLNSLRPNQKSEWSEENADMLNCCISSIEEAKENRYAYKETDGDTSYDREIDWLKSLRPQPHTVSTNNATKFGNLEYERGVKDGIQSEKSHQWKPSEEQMDALRASNSYWRGASNETPCINLLESLYNDLKKLI